MSIGLFLDTWTIDDILLKRLEKKKIKRVGEE